MEKCPGLTFGEVQWEDATGGLLAETIGMIPHERHRLHRCALSSNFQNEPVAEQITKITFILEDGDDTTRHVARLFLLLFDPRHRNNQKHEPSYKENMSDEIYFLFVLFKRCWLVNFRPAVSSVEEESE